MKTPIPEVELLSFDDIGVPPPMPLWMELEPLPNIYRDYLLKKIEALDNEDRRQKQEFLARLKKSKNLSVMT